ncbi:hypothetical protein M2D07_004030 [Pseudomonas sp. BGr12]|uniref:hypothetical protein n=1 Tax=unclassified Pseudomonas TaxID=196821 RepID=UPI00178408EF|nr:MULTISPECIES: hypothetical protein [unclassified Pseudomonas]MBD9502801.1 hypothetical protein [Pseudomonas sp. PDM17]MBD9574724.1 hypothetical protein [Pseudomonas sp. PDM23]MBD9673855.1 hypothetical protein [Pseudomonas sp. PDM21]MDL2426181.1 hypothetical protein [Pseudomonas sp. BJa5]
MRRSLFIAAGFAAVLPFAGPPSSAWADGMPEEPSAPPVPTSPATPPPSTPGSWPVPDAQPVAYAVLIVSRERLDTGTACDIDLYVQDEKVSRLQPEGEIALNLPPGEVSLRLQTANSGLCRSGIQPLRAQSVQLHAGEVRKFRIANSESGLYLMPVSSGS